jgi:uncharacterized protein YxjI
MSESEVRGAALGHLPPPPAPGTGSAPRPDPPRPDPSRRRGRPAFGKVVIAAIGLRGGREVLERVAWSRYGLLGFFAVGTTAAIALVLWRWSQRRRVSRRGDVEFTPEMVAKQIADSEVGPPAFPEDGTLLGASILVVNQRPKLVEVNTEFEVFGADAQRLGGIRQIGQSKAKRLVRIVTAWDQFLTHHFELLDASGAPVLRLTRPRKLFRTKVHVFDGNDRFLGTIRQENIFWKIRFQIVDGAGNVVGHMHAENLRAWDFQVLDAGHREIARVVKSWEGWANTAFTRADRYVVHIHAPLPFPLRELALATALSADLALKQDARAFG